MATLYENYITGDNTSVVVADFRWDTMAFTPSITHSLTSVKLKLLRKGSPGNLTVSIRATTDSGSSPFGKIPTGSDIDGTTGTTNGNTLTSGAAGEWREITLGAAVRVNAGTAYAIVIRALTGDATNNYVAWRWDDSGATYGDGNRAGSFDSGSSWSAPGLDSDLMFEEWGDPVSPTVTTQTCADVVGVTATGRGNITDLGSTSVTAHGHVWGTSTNPDTGDSLVDNGAASATGAFASALTALIPGTVYYTRAYAINSIGTSYGGNVRFTASLSRAGIIWMEGSNLRGFDENAIEGKYIRTADVDDAPVNGEIEFPISSNWAFDHVAAADPHVGYVLESLFDAQTVLHATSDDTPVALTVTEQTLVGRQTGGNIAAVPIGISNNDIVEIDHASVTDDDYAKFTTTGLEGRSYQELVNDISGVIKATDVEVSELSTATYDDVQDYMNFKGDRTLLTGGDITDNGDGTIAVTSGTAWAKATDSDTAVGKFFNFSADNSVALSDLATNYIYLDYNGGTPQMVVATSILTHGFKQDHVLVGTSFRDGLISHFHHVDTVGIGRMGRVDMHHREEHAVHRVDGIVTSSVGTRNLSITAGVLYEGISRHTTSPFTTPNSGTADATEANKLHDADGGFATTDVGKTVHNTTDDTYAEVTAFVDSGELTLSADIFISGENYDLDSFTYWYTTDSGSTWTEVRGATAISNTQYNNIASGLVNLTANRYGVHWVYMEVDGEHFHVLYGQGNYKINEAEEATPPSISPNIVNQYCALIAKIIVQQGTDTLNIMFPWTTVFTSSFATDHGSLGGLADDDHLQYLLADGTRALSGAWDMGSQLITNLKLGGTMDANSQALINVLDFDLGTESITGTFSATLTAANAGTAWLIKSKSTSDILRPRLGLSGGVDTAVWAWVNSTHTGIVLSGALDANSQNLTNVGTLNAHTIPGGTDTFAMLAATQELDNKTLDSSVLKGTFTASGTVVLPAFTMGGAILAGDFAIGSQASPTGNITVGYLDAIKIVDSGGTARSVLAMGSALTLRLTSPAGTMLIDSSIATDITLWGGSAGTNRRFALYATNSDAGNTLRNAPSILLRAKYWTGAADTAWEYIPTHTMQTAGATPKSVVAHRVNGVLALSHGNNNGAATLGFYGAAAVAKASAYTQTYSTANKTIENPTGVSMGDLVATSGGWGASTEANFDKITAVIDQLIADNLDLRQGLTAVIDDLQAVGLVG